MSRSMVSDVAQIAVERQPEPITAERLSAFGLIGWLRGWWQGQSKPDGRIVRTGEFRPKRVLVMRHAEKTGNEDDIHLSKPGYMRAKRLASYIPETFGTPDFIFAAAKSKRSIRSIETVTPLALALGKTVRYDIEDKQFSELVSQLFSEPVYAGAVVVVCWHHSKIPEIARMLGDADGVCPTPWPYELYDVIVDISYAADGTASVRAVKQPF